MKKTDYDNDNESKLNYTPKFPSDSSDFVAVGAWKDEMVGYLCEKGLYTTALNGKAPRYPGYVHSEKEAAPLAILKAGVDSEYNTKVHGIMLQSVKGVSSSLYKTLLNPPYLVNASGQGKGILRLPLRQGERRRALLRPLLREQARKVPQEVHRSLLHGRRVGQQDQHVRCDQFGV